MAGYINGYTGQLNPASQATIADGETVSSAINTGGAALCGIYLPAAFTGATVSFEASPDGVSYSAVKSTTSGTALSYTVTQGTYCAIDPKDFQGIAYLKIVSASAEAAARTLYCALKGM